MNSVSQRNDDDDPWPEPSEMGHSGTGVVPSAGTYLKDSLLLRRAGTLAQVSSLNGARHGACSDSAQGRRPRDKQQESSLVLYAD